MFLKVLLALVVVAECAAVPLFLKYYWPDRCKQSFILKIVSAALFVLCGYLSVQISGNNTPYAKLIMIGLVLGFFGDVFLHSLSDNKIHFVIGFLSFFAGHFFYIAAFWKAIQKTYPGSHFIEWYELLATVLLIGGLLASFIKRGIFKGKGILLVVFTVYGLVLATMMTKSFRYAIGEIAYGTNDHMFAVFVCVAIGGLLFCISDTILGYTIPMGKITRALRIVNIGTYFTAQILIALSILFVRSAYPLY